MHARRRFRERLVALVLAGALLFSYPLVHLFGNGVLVLGVPLLYVYLFVVWAGFIVLAAVLVERNAPGGAGEAPKAR